MRTPHRFGLEGVKRLGEQHSTFLYTFLTEVHGFSLAEKPSEIIGFYGLRDAIFCLWHHQVLLQFAIRHFVRGHFQFPLWELDREDPEHHTAAPFLCFLLEAERWPQRF